MLRGTDRDGEGLVELGSGEGLAELGNGEGWVELGKEEGLVELGNGIMKQTREMDVKFDSKRDSANVDEGRQRRSGQNWW